MINAKINVKSCYIISVVDKKNNETCKNYFKIEKNCKLRYFFNSLNECYTLLLRANSGIQMLLFDNMVVKLNGKNHCRPWWWIIVYTKLVFLIYCTKKFLKILDYFSYSLFSCMRFGNVQNTVGVNHSRCCAIAEMLWSCSRLPEISKFLKIRDGYIIAAKCLIEGLHPISPSKGR